ncbi:168_t:CDS:2, partial [Gigaspora rosea]
KNKEKEYTEGDRKKKTKIYLEGKVEKLCSRYIEELKASLVQEIISQIEQEENLSYSTNQKLDSRNVYLNRNKGKIDDFLELKVGIHNINGVKNDSYRLQELVDFGTREKFNLLGIVETNIDSRQEKFIEIDRSRYLDFWTNAEKDKKKGSGVGALINKKWAAHITKVQKRNPYSLEIYLTFKKTMIVFWTLYFPSNERTIRTFLQKEVINAIATRKRDTYYILGVISIPC